MSLQPSKKFSSQAIHEYRAAQAKRRAEAFCDAPEYVLGIEVRPLTPATFSMLYATQSAFVFDTRNAAESDVLNYLWLHSPLYCHTGVHNWSARKKQALRRFMFELTQPWRKWVGLRPDYNRYNAALNLAIADVRRIIDEAFADSPARSGKPGKPIATVEAFFIHEFAVAYGWTAEQTRHYPLKRILQLHRCIRSARGEELSDEGEDRILAEHLRERNAELAAQRKAANV